MTPISAKLDLTKTDKTYYSAKSVPQPKHFPAYHYLMVSGEGPPSSDSFARCTEALFTMAYGVKQLYKQEGREFTVPKLEGLWWVNGGHDALSVTREAWRWKLLLRMPDFVSARSVETARDHALTKKKMLEQLHDVSFESLHEGACVQILHTGPYDSEPESIAKIQAYMELQRLIPNGLHHEIYLSDPRKASPDTLRTIIRYPVAQQ